MVDFDNNKKSLLSVRGEEILRNRESKKNQFSTEQSNLSRKIIQTQKQLATAEGDLSRDMDSRLASLKIYNDQLESLYKAQESLKQKSSRISNRNFESEIKKYTSNSSSNQEISQIQKSFENYGVSLDIAKTSSTQDLYRRVRIGRADLEVFNNSIRSTDPSTKEGADAIRQRMAQREGVIGNIGITQSAIDMQKRLGIDIDSQYKNAYRHQQSSMDRLRDNSARDEVRSGMHGNSQKETQEKLLQASMKVIEAFNQLDAATRSGSEDIGKLGVAAQKAYDEEQKALRIHKEMTARSFSGDGGNMAATGSILGSFGSGIRSAAEIYRYAGISSEYEQTQNRIGLANRENQRFQDVMDVSRGSYSAFRRINNDEFGKETARLRLMRNRESVAAGGVLLGNATGAIGNSIGAIPDLSEAAAAFGMSPIAGSAAFAKIASGAITGSRDTAVSAIDYSKSNSVIQQGLLAAAQRRELNDTLNYVGNIGGQQAIDYFKNITLATRGLGSTRAGTQREFIPRLGVAGVDIDPSQVPGYTGGGTELATSPGIYQGSRLRGRGARESLMQQLAGPNSAKFIQQLASEAGLSDSEIPKLVGMGVGQLGKNLTAEDIKNSGIEAKMGRLQSPEQYLQLRGQLANVGGGSQDLENIMKNAVANGMDSSKNIMQMVDATAAIASTSAGAGMSTVSGAAQGIGRGIDLLRGVGVSENMAGTAAKLAGQAVEGFSKINSPDIANVMQFGQLRSSFSGINTPQLMALQKISPSQWRQMEILRQKGDTSQLDLLQTQLGISDIKGISGEEQIRSGRRASIEASVSRITGGPGVVGSEAFKREVDETLSGKFTKQTLTEASRFQTITGTGVSGIGELGYIAGGKTLQDKLEKGYAGLTGTGEKALNAPAEFDAKTMTDTMSKLGGNIEGLAKAFTDASKLLPSNYMDAAKTSADTMSTSVSQLGTSMVDLKTSIDSLTTEIRKMGGKAVDYIPNIVGSLMNNKDPELGKGPMR